MQVKKNLVFLVLLGILSMTSCRGQDRSQNASNLDMYFGQQAPGKKAKPFAPDVLTFEPHDSPIIIADEKYMIIGSTEPAIKFLGMRDGRLTIVDSVIDFDVPFNDIPYSYNGMCISPSANRVYFLIWLKDDENFYFIEKTGNSWSEPEFLSEEVNAYRTHWQFSVAMNENFYFSSDGIKISRFDGSKHLKPVPLYDINNEELPGSTPYIAPDESYLLLSIDNDLYISYHLNSDKWSVPKNLGAGINSEFLENCPIVSPDEKYLFFITRRNSSDFSIYWADAGFIEELRPKE